MKYLAKDNGKTIPMVEIRKNVLKRTHISGATL